MNQIYNTGSKEQNIIVRCGRFHLCTHTMAQVTESESCSNPAHWTAVASRLQWHSYNCTFSVINHYLIRFAYIMALVNQLWVGVPSKISTESRGALMIISPLWSAHRIPLLSCAVINVSAKMSAEGGDTFRKWNWLRAWNQWGAFRVFTAAIVHT